MASLVLIETQIAKRYAGLNVIKRDILLSNDAFRKFTEHPQEQLIKIALLFFAVVNYGKCFTTAEGRGVQLNERDCFSTDGQHATHKAFMDIRNNFVADAGKGDFEIHPVSLNLSPRHLCSGVR